MKDDTQNLQSKQRSRQTSNLLKAKLLHRLPESGSFPTAIPGLRLSRRDATGQKENCFYRPMLALVVQGSKRSLIGGAGASEYCYGEGSCVVVAVDVPSMIHITEASPEKPFLSLSIALDRQLIRELEAELPAMLPAVGKGKPVTVAKVTPELLDAFLRLVELLDRHEQIPVLAPMIVREIHYHLLCGPQGESLRLFCAAGNPDSQIVQAISWLRENYRKKLRITDLAVRMSTAESTFNRHFRRVTGLSPLQFQKRLRLYEAQRLMLAENKSAETAAFDVGYESPAQFNREYKREFGEPPRRDINRLAVAETANRLIQA
jgi:AraC-like DNA-binding protein